MGNRIGMISGGYYGVISPEGAASILGRYKNEADKAIHFPKDCHSLAIAQRIYANQLKDIGIVDEIIWEKYDGEQEHSESFTAFPILGARIRDFIARSLGQLLTLNEDGLIANRYEKFRSMGVYEILSEEERVARVHAAVEKVGSKSKKEVSKTASAVVSKIIQFISQTSMNGEYSR
jgi:acetyl-CoA carboxylase alpha subunit